MRAKKKSFMQILIGLYKQQQNLYKNTESIFKIEQEKYLQKHLFGNPKYNQPDKLNRYEYSAFSQNGEDGIIEEIFKRIGIYIYIYDNIIGHKSNDHFFVEFGVGNGTENNSINLLYNGWKGLWIEGNGNFVKSIHQNFSNAMQSDKLKVLHNFITAENIEDLFKAANVPAEFDLLSIDIDRNDYYVWKAIKSYRPKVVIIEYNSIFRPGCEFVVPYNATATWDGSSNFGASLSALYKLGLEKGYKLVACDFTGVNAFFVREDLIGDKFQGPFTPENHYEPPRYFLYAKNGHPRKVIL
jgi:hypothetical protein